VLRCEDGSLRFLVHPELRTIVQGEDLAYIEALLLDLPERAKQHPEELFKQISSLNVGLLVVNEVGSSFSEHPSLIKLLTQFIHL
jgi:hypothetical protein